jgi:hypothetical protein
MWFSLSKHLALRSWYAMMTAINSNTLGFLLLVLGVAICIWFTGFLFKWRELGNASLALKESKKVILVELIGVTLFIAFCLPTFMVRTMAYDHNGMRYELQKDTEQIRSLDTELDYRKNNISTTDAVFPNLIYMMGAFRSFKNAIGSDSCVVRYTAPRETEPLASVFAQFSIQTDNCPTFGPGLGDFDPDEVSDTNDGMVPDAVVFHAAKGDKAADVLFMNLGNQIRMVRSYDLGRANYQVPSGGYKHRIWLQFGSKVKWNSEQ